MVQATPPSLALRDIARSAVRDPANAEVMAALVDLMGVMQRTRALRQQGAPGTALLIHLAKCGPMRATTLAAAMHLDQSTVSRHLAHLTAAGLVERTTDPDDRRAQVMAVTDQGRAHAQEAVAARMRDFEDVLATWSDDDRATFAHLLGRFSAESDRRLTEGDPQ